MSFVHLHNHTHYSLLDSITKTDELIKAAKASNQPAVALTDHGVMFGVVEFCKKCKEEEIKPIIGFEAYIANGSRLEKPKVVKGKKQRNYYHIILLAKNDTGYHNLLKLTSIGFKEGHYHRPRIDKEVLEKYTEGIICTSACMGGIVNADIIDGNLDKAKEEAIYYKNLFGDDFYMELQRHRYPEDERLIKHAVEIARELDIKLIATNDIHYLKREHAIAHNVLLSISSSQKGVDYKRLRYGTDEFYFKSTEEMKELFSDYPEAIENTLEIADKCNFELELDVLHMPQFPIPETSKATDLDEYLKELSYEMMVKTRTKGEPISKEYKKRMDYELSIIKQMGFPGYFLIVQDFINEAKRRGVPVGPGRGSAAGSLVAYALGITNIDPIRFDLLFERFLNPERVSMPDIDIDFCDENRSVVMDYVRERYGEDAVAQIVTFSKLTMKAVVNDVGRVLNIPLSEVREVSSAIPDKGTMIGDKKIKTLKDALEHVPELQFVKEKAQTDQKFQELIDISLVLENTNRGRGTHAAGVIIAPGPVANFVPTCSPVGAQKDAPDGLDLVTQFQNSSGEVEACGLLKMDFLGLRTLSIISRTLDMIEHNHGIKIDPDEIPLDDTKTYELLSRGETQAIFQFESPGMQEYLKQLKPQSIEELTAMNALYRPGPMENIPEFIDVKNDKRDMNCYHDDLEDILKETYGVIVYQEQVMRVAQKLAGFSLGGADVMRRIMGKKKEADMAKLKPDFIGGFKKQGYDKQLADKIWDVLLPFCNYGFNKSHAVAYSYVAYQTAYFKAHYPAEFIASNMTAEMNLQERVVALIDEAKRYEIAIKPPDVNISFSYFYAPNGKEIYYGMAGIKNVGVPIVESIVETRKKELFKSFFDFFAKSDKKVLNKRAVEALICAGAFDSVADGKRRPLFEAIEDGLNYAKAIEKTNANATASLFAEVQDAQIPEPPLPDVPDWDEPTRLANEKEFLNFYLTGHPLNSYKTILSNIAATTIENLNSTEANAQVRVVGLINSIAVKRSGKDGRSFAVLKIEDYKDKIEAVLWADEYETNAHKLTADSVVVAAGSLKRKQDTQSLYLDDIFTIDEIIERYLSEYKIFINIDNGALDKLTELKKMANSSFRAESDKTKFLFDLYNLNKDFRKLYEAAFAFDNSYSNLKAMQKLFDPDNEGNIAMRFILPEFKPQKQFFSKKKS
jgi:DNA polymerase III subunit alpha